MAETLLEIDNVRLSYGSLEVLKGVSLTVDRGEAFAVIGPNGAGKTTLFKAMTGEARTSSGRVTFAGTDVTRTPAFKRARLGMGRTFQVARVFQDFTPVENVVATIETREQAAGRSVGAWYQWKPSGAIVDEANHTLDMVGLKSRRALESRFLSHGDKKRLELAITLAQMPRILMLDEPTAGMSIADRAATIEMIRKLKNETGVTIVMTEHDMDVIFGLADRLVVLNYGEIIATGTVEEVRRNPLVKEVYLGKEMYGA